MCLKGWVKTETCRFNGWLWSEERCYEVRGEDTRLNRIACFWGENREEASAIVERGTRVRFGCFEKYYFRKYLTYPVVKISGVFFFFFFYSLSMSWHVSLPPFPLSFFLLPKQICLYSLYLFSAFHSTLLSLSIHTIFIRSPFPPLFFFFFLIEYLTKYLRFFKK